MPAVRTLPLRLALGLAALRLRHRQAPGPETPQTSRDDLEADWRTWLTRLFPSYVSDSGGQLIPFAEHHAEFWTWVWSLRRGMAPVPFIGVWPRKGAKSTSAELACVAIGARRLRRYGLYVCDTQDRADDHVSSIGAMLESRALEHHYPDLANRLVGKYGHSKGWRRNRLRTRSRFIMDSLGLDVASRGVKLEEMIPDFIILDDIDAEDDSPGATQKKLTLLSRKLLPALSPDAAILGIQNLIHPDGVFTRLVDGRAEFLVKRSVSGPIAALVGMAYKLGQLPNGRPGYLITAGTPTWAGQDLPRCQALMNVIGLTAFLIECQHEAAARLVVFAFSQTTEDQSLARTFQEPLLLSYSIDVVEHRA